MDAVTNADQFSNCFDSIHGPNHDITFPVDRPL